MNQDAKLSVTHAFRGMDSSDSVKSYAEKKATKIGKHLHQQTDYQITYSMERGKFTAEVHVTSGDFEAKASATDETLYAAIDEASDKILQQSRKFKEMHGNRGGTPHHNQ